MPRITPLTCKAIERKLKAIGFGLDHVDGSIKYFVREKNGEAFMVQVHFHNGDKDPDTIRSIMRTGGINRSEWINAK